MADLYVTKVTATGGRHGQIRSEDGLLDLKLALPKSLGVLAALPIQSSFSLVDIPPASRMLSCGQPVSLVTNSATSMSK